ncbi:MerR family transcriptional regulator [Fusibacter paucivorans]|uniref:MerR family transcriptional regulator n=1 Tax=Fusibacter paucivorans TaxID=76009 RepID=A0ABS5PQL8_9FIRM|nr:MerR family transcriptional regulator [Fusibacter paucivorans]MBS7526671.1 MerR family transcriptional regulator [Fusibacter paucivorans]
MYSITELANLSGITTRTLRYYESIGLIEAGRNAESGYRFYDEVAVDQLQHILILRELAVPLKDIASILKKPNDEVSQLKAHLNALKDEEKRLKRIIATVEKTIVSKERGTIMDNHEKFEGFKAERIAENEALYGEEIRRRYGNDTIDAANEKFLKLTPKKAQEAEGLSAEIERLILEGLRSGDSEGIIAKKLAEVHRDWLTIYWVEYAGETHRQLAEMYLSDDRFKVYYERIGEGATAFLVNAIKAHIKE